MVKLRSIVPLLIVAGCTSIPTQAKHHLLGLSKDELLACAGVPDSSALIDSGQILEWKQDTQVQGPLSIKTPINFELDIGGHGTCHLVIRLVSNKVAQVEYTGPSATLYGPYDACKPLVRSCEKYISHRRGY